MSRRTAWTFLNRLLKDQEAATAVEYAVMLALILLTAMAALMNVSSSTGGMWSGIETELTSAMGT